MEIATLVRYPYVPYVLDTHLSHNWEAPNCVPITIARDMADSFVPNVSGFVFPSMQLEDRVHLGPPNLRTPKPQGRLRKRMLGPFRNMWCIPNVEIIRRIRITREFTETIWTV